MITLKNFLSYFPDYYIQTFDDSGRDRAGLVTIGTPKEYSEMRLRQLNAEGAGIFFTPNRFPKQRGIAYCEGVNAWYCESDSLSIDQQYENLCNCPLMPSLIVKSVKSLHAYWLAEDATIENFKKIQNGLIAKFQGDPTMKDISKVLRIPTYYHNKKEPVLVEIIWDEGNKYTEKQMLEAFPFTEVEKIKLQPKKIEEGLDFWTSASRLDNKTVLKRLTGSVANNHEQITFRKRSSGGEYIDINGKPADAWLDINGMIGSGKNGGPTFVQWLEFYGWKKGDIAKWVKENCKDLLPNSALGIQVESEDIQMANLQDGIQKFLDRKMDLTWGTPLLDKTFTPLSRGKYVVLVGETGSGKTAWAFWVALQNAEAGRKVLYLSLEMDNAMLVARYVMRKLKISKEQYKNKDYDKEKFINESRKLPPTLFCRKITSSSVNIDEVVRIISEGDYDMVFIDNFGYLDTDGLDTNDKIKNISRKLVDIRKNKEVVIFALHHFRKKSSGGKNAGTRGMDAILGSAKIGHDVDFSIELFRDTSLDKDSSDADRAEVAVCQLKDRDFGERVTETVYYKNGGFYDIF